MTWTPEPPERPLSVGALTQRLKRLLEVEIGEVWVRGEISNLRRQASGHFYFTLKDADAQLSAVLFRADAARLPAPPEEGQAAVAFGRLTVYAPRGSYQLVVRHLQPEGEGDLRRRFEVLKRKLAEEGLFDPGRKRPLPRLPSTIALVTSPTGAAAKDFLSILRRRGWRGRVRLLPVRVQGSEAAGEIAAQLAFADQHGLGEVIVLTRGGGSLEDLWPFNEEIVARAVAASSCPVISAVGHEIDFSLSDFAADVRAETPSAAAELISSEFIEFAESLLNFRRRLQQAGSRALEHHFLTLRARRERLRGLTPRHQVEQAWLRLDELRSRQGRAWERRAGTRREALRELSHRLELRHPEERLRNSRAHLAHLAIRLRQAGPEAALQRGYALVHSKTGQIVTRRADLAPGTGIEVEWADGRARFEPARAPVRKPRPAQAPNRSKEQLNLPLDEPSNP